MEMNEVIQESKGFYKLNWLQRIGFGSGDLAQNLIYQTIGMYLLLFYTNVYGIDPAAVAVMFLVVRLVDVLWDPLVGTYVDKHSPRLGKYRAYLVLGGIPLSGFAILCFWNGFSGSLLYAYVTYVGMSMCYTLVNVPYGALNASLTRDTNEITILTSVRMFMANLGGLAVSLGIPILVAAMSPDGKMNTVEDAGAWFVTMTLYALVGMVLLVFCFTQCKALCDERFVPVLSGWFADGCDGALLQYPVDDSGDEKDRIVFRPEDDRYFLADLYIYRLIILFPYRSIGGERCLYRRLLRWSYFRLGRYLYFPGAKYECRYGCIGTCDR